MLSRTGKGLSINVPIKENPDKIDKTIQHQRQQLAKDSVKDVDLHIDSLVSKTEDMKKIKDDETKKRERLIAKIEAD